MNAARQTHAVAATLPSSAAFGDAARLRRGGAFGPCLSARLRHRQQDRRGIVDVFTICSGRTGVGGLGWVGGVRRLTARHQSLFIREDRQTLEHMQPPAGPGGRSRTLRAGRVTVGGGSHSGADTETAAATPTSAVPKKSRNSVETRTE